MWWTLKNYWMMIWIKFIKLFAFGIDFNSMDWIIDGEAKIRVAIRDHIFSFFSCSSPITQNPHHKPKIPLRPTSGIHSMHKYKLFSSHLYRWQPHVWRRCPSSLSKTKSPNVIADEFLENDFYIVVIEYLV